MDRPLRFWPRPLALTCLVAATCLVAQPAWAADRKQAHKLMQRGAAAYERQDYADALTNFRAAYEFIPSPKILYDIAQCHLKLGHDLEAAEALETFLASGGSDEHHDSAKAALEGLETRLARLRLSVVPPNAVLVLDEKPIHAGQIFVAAGTHSISASLPGYQGQARSISLEKGDSKELAMVLDREGATPQRSDPEAAAPPQKQAPARLSITTEPAGATVTSGSLILGVAPLTTQLAPGSYPLHASLSGYRDASEVVELAQGRSSEVALRLEPVEHTRVFTWLALGLAGVGGGVGLGFGVSAHSAYSDLQSGPHAQPQVQELYNRASGQATAANVCFGAAAVLAAAGVVLFFVEPSL